MAFNIDIAIVALFLVFTMIIGFGHGRKVQTIQDYALGGRDFSTAALVATIVATGASGSGFFVTLSKTYSNGLYYSFASLGMAVQLLIIAYIFVPKMQRFLGNTSIAESIGNIYGNKVRIITAFTGSIGTVGRVAVQFKAFGVVLGYFAGLNPELSIILSGMIVIFYSASGGVKAVTTTDVLQFVSFGFAIPFVGILLWHHLFHQGISILEPLESVKFNFNVVFNTNNPEFWATIPLALFFMTPGMEPVFCQRIIMGKNISQVRRAFAISAIFLIFIKFAISWISFLVFAANPDLMANELLGYIIDNYTITGVKGLVIIGVISMAMSTADSSINSSAVLFANDICSPLGIGVKKELFISRLFSIFLGLGGIILAISIQDLLSIIIAASSFYGPIATAPIILTILGFRTTEKIILLGMLAGGLTVLFWDFMNISAGSVVAAEIANMTIIISLHYLTKQKGGWIDTGYSVLGSLKNSINEYISTIQRCSFYKLIINIAPRSVGNFVSLGMYFLLYTITTIYSIQDISFASSQTIVLSFYQVMLITSTALIMIPIWPQIVTHAVKEKFARVFWFVSILYMLVFLNTFFVIASDFSRLQFSIFSINLLVTSILLGWRISLFVIPIGFYLSKAIFYKFLGDYQMNADLVNPDFILMYAAILTCIVLVVFLKPQQERYEETEAKVEVLEGEVQDLDSTITALQDKEMQYQSEISSLNEAVDHYSERVADQAKEIERLGATAQKILNNVNHELRLPVGNVMNFAEMLYEGLGNYSQEQLKELTDEVYQNSTRLSTMILNMLDLATLDVKKVGLVKSTENFSELVRDRVKICRNIYLQGKPIDFKLIIEPEILISIDPNYMRQVVDNLVINAINFSEKGTIEIAVRRNDDAVVMTLRDQGKGIMREELFDIFKPFKMGSNSECQSQGRGVGLALCKSAVEAHGGSILAESPGGIGALFTIILMR